MVIEKSTNRLKHLNHYKSSIDDSFSSESTSPQNQVILSNSNIIDHSSSREDLEIFSSEDENDLSLIDTKEVLEENIGKEIERILIKIYNYHITNPEAISNKQMVRTEKHVS